MHKRQQSKLAEVLCPPPDLPLYVSGLKLLATDVNAWAQH